MKKFRIGAFVLALVVSAGMLYSCGDDKKDDNKKDTEKAEKTKVTTVAAEDEATGTEKTEAETEGKEAVVTTAAVIDTAEPGTEATETAPESEITAPESEVFDVFDDFDYTEYMDEDGNIDVEKFKAYMLSKMSDEDIADIQDEMTELGMSEEEYWETIFSMLMIGSNPEMFETSEWFDTDVESEAVEEEFDYSAYMDEDGNVDAEKFLEDMYAEMSEDEIADFKAELEADGMTDVEFVEFIFAMAQMGEEGFDSELAE